jgi:hypothetical protein
MVARAEVVGEEDHPRELAVANHRPQGVRDAAALESGDQALAAELAGAELIGARLRPIGARTEHDAGRSGRSGRAGQGRGAAIRVP